MEGNELRDFLKELVEFLKVQDVAEFDLEQADLKVRLKFAGEAPTAPAAGLDLAQLQRLLAATPGSVAAAAAANTPAPASAAPVPVTPAPAAQESAHHTVRSPLVGTFYEASSPGAAPFVKIGDQVEVGQVLCIVEAMKLMNEVESDVAGEVVERIAKAGQPVEYGQPLFAVKAN